MGGIESALRERLEMGGCTPVGGGEDGPELWFTPHLNACFALPSGIATPGGGNAVLRAAGMEETF